MRIRVEYEKGKEIRYLSHLQLMRLVERTLRRAKIPYALSEGFSPHVRLSLGTVLPVGVWGLREYFDLELAGEIACDEFVERMNRVAPAGFQVKRARFIDQAAPSLQIVVNTALYCIVLDTRVKEEEASSVLDTLMQSDRLPVLKSGSKNQEKDLRQAIYRLDMTKYGERLAVLALVSAGSKDNVRPDELICCLKDHGLPGDVADVYRIANYHREPDGRLFLPFDM